MVLGVGLNPGVGIVNVLEVLTKTIRPFPEPFIHEMETELEPILENDSPDVWVTGTVQGWPFKSLKEMNKDIFKKKMNNSRVIYSIGNIAKITI